MVAEIIVALDLESTDEALRLVDQLSGLRWAKVGSVLFMRSGPPVVRALRDRGIEVFLDLKWHDVPSTVAGAAAGAAALGVGLVTVHALGGTTMVEAAVAAAGETRVAAVTVLTSHGSATFEDSLGLERSDIQTEVVRLAQIGLRAGAGAIVVSPLEVASVRRAVGPAPWMVVPGIRLPGAAADDQRRTATPQEALAAGATHLVIGRPLTRAQMPRAVYEELCETVC